MRNLYRGKTHQRIVQELSSNVRKPNPNLNPNPNPDPNPNPYQGDRAPKSKWQRVTGPVDVVVLEGWCLGFLQP